MSKHLRLRRGVRRARLDDGSDALRAIRSVRLVPRALPRPVPYPQIAPLLRPVPYPQIALNLAR
jgi:hypothetical protein